MRKLKILIFSLIFCCIGIAANAQSDYKGVVIASYADWKYVLAVPNGNYRNGQSLILWRYSKTLADQVFTFIKTNQATSILPFSAEHLCIAIPQGLLFDGNKIILWNNNVGNEQQWILDNIQGSVYVIRSLLNRNWVLGVEGTPTSNSSITIQQYSGADTQKWYIVSRNSSLFPIYQTAVSN